jgi:hypothetical protein
MQPGIEGDLVGRRRGLGGGGGRERDDRGEKKGARNDASPGDGKPPNAPPALP